MNNNTIEYSETELLAPIRTDWKRAADVGQEIGSSLSPKQIAKRLNKINDRDHNIDKKMKRGYFYYKLKSPESILTPQETPIIPDIPRIPRAPEPANNKDIGLIIKDLRDYGINIQKLIYDCLTREQAKVKTEYDYVLKNAPSIAAGFIHLKDEMEKTRKKLLDYRDEIDDLTKKTMVQRFTEERKAREGVL